MRNLATDEERATNSESECTLGVPGRAEGADSSNLQQKSSCQTPTLALSQWEEWWALKRVGREEMKERAGRGYWVFHCWQGG